MSIIRDRWIYALLFSGRRCYIGQSVNLSRRFKSHSAPSGGWDEEFEILVLGRVTGTEWDAIWFEYAWRWKAHQAGWSVYSRPKILIENIDSAIMDDVKAFGSTLTWDTSVTLGQQSVLFLESSAIDLVQLRRGWAGKHNAALHELCKSVRSDHNSLAQLVDLALAEAATALEAGDYRKVKVAQDQANTLIGELRLGIQVAARRTYSQNDRSFENKPFGEMTPRDVFQILISTPAVYVTSIIYCVFIFISASFMQAYSPPSGPVYEKWLNLLLSNVQSLAVTMMLLCVFSIFLRGIWGGLRSFVGYIAERS